MHLIVHNIKVPIENDGIKKYLKELALKMKIEAESITFIKILSKALDSRDFEQFFYKLSFAVSVPDDYKNKAQFPAYAAPVVNPKNNIQNIERPIIIGFGPAGMFAALEFIDNGIKPIIFDRGKKIEDRSVDVQTFISKRQLNPDSNIQFGEGGAGSYSDGKLFSRRNNNTSYVSRVLDTFIKFGAPGNLGYIAKPHLGTDVLCNIVRNIRNYLLERGAEIHYSSMMTDLILTKGVVSGVVINGKQEFLSSSVYLAIGHSARETYGMLHGRGVCLEQKQISVGLRIEHPAEIIDLIRYGKKYQNHPALGAATYSLNYTNKKKRTGVYTFCMCPGGEVVNASSSNGLLVVNGMSYSTRSLPFSNGALVVPCPVDMFGGDDPLDGISFQEEIEEKAFIEGGKSWKAPAQNLNDFLINRPSETLNENSYKMNVQPADMHRILPPSIIEQLKDAFAYWKREVPLFVSHHAILLGAETRTSSPVRIVRDDNFQSINTKGLFLIGEGAGYTGGITSSAADGLRAVDCYLNIARAI